MKNLFYCEKCDYHCRRKFCWEQHLLTAKHQKANNGLLKAIKKYACDICDISFKHQSSYSRHKKNCNNKMNLDKKNEEFKFDNNIFLELLKQNQEFKELITEQNKTIIKLAENSSNQMNITNNNIHNKTINNKFNLQVFLNEKCKDALNITDFVNSLNLSLTDLENVGEFGFVNGISKIFVKGLKNLDIYKRPIHCSDLKRETMHLKEETGWEKDNENKDKLKKVVKMIAHKNMLKISDWKKQYPQYNNSDSKKNDQYLKILISSSGSYNKNDEENEYDKIIRNVAKEVTIDKEL